MRVARPGAGRACQGSISSLAPSRFPRCRRCALRADLGRDRRRVRPLRVFRLSRRGSSRRRTFTPPSRSASRSSRARSPSGSTAGRSRPVRATAFWCAPARATSSGTQARRRHASRAVPRLALQFEQLIETMFSLAQAGKTNRKGMPNPLRLALGAPMGLLLGYRATYGAPGRAARGRGRSGMTSPAMSSFARRCIARVAESEGRRRANAFARRRPRRVDPRAGHARGVPRRRADGGRGLGCVRHDRNAVDFRGYKPRRQRSKDGGCP